MIFPDNMGEYLSIDETSLSNGEIYTIVTNKAAKGRKHCLVAMIKGTVSDFVSDHINRISMSKRKLVKEITADLSESMKKIVLKSFPCAILTIDRFHVQKIALECLQQMRVDYRWQVIENENQTIKTLKEKGETYTPTILNNGDSLKQLLARSRYLLFKSREKWTPSQQLRAKTLFFLYPDLEKAYNLVHKLRMIYSHAKEENVLKCLSDWFDDVERSGFKYFNAFLQTLQNRYPDIINYFKFKNTNAGAESFNAKIKKFRAKLNGVNDRTFFLFRIAKIWA